VPAGQIPVNAAFCQRLPGEGGGRAIGGRAPTRALRSIRWCPSRNAAWCRRPGPSRRNVPSALPERAWRPSADSATPARTGCVCPFEGAALVPAARPPIAQCPVPDYQRETWRPVRRTASQRSPGPVCPSRARLVPGGPDPSNRTVWFPSCAGDRRGGLSADSATAITAWMCPSRTRAWYPQPDPSRRSVLSRLPERAWRAVGGTTRHRGPPRPCAPAKVRNKPRPGNAG